MICVKKMLRKCKEVSEMRDITPGEEVCLGILFGTLLGCGLFGLFYVGSLL